MIKSKISKNIGIILKVRHIFHISTLRTLYFSFIHPYITYCIKVWGRCATVHLESIYRLQKVCCRLISNSPVRTESTPLFKKLNVLNVYQLYTLSVSLIMYRFCFGVLPKYIVNCFSYRYELTNVVTRQRNHLAIPLCKTKISQNCLKFMGAKLWNRIITMMELNVSQNMFKRRIKNLLFEKKLNFL